MFIKMERISFSIVLNGWILDISFSRIFAFEVVLRVPRNLVFYPSARVACACVVDWGMGANQPSNADRLAVSVTILLYLARRESKG